MEERSAHKEDDEQNTHTDRKGLNRMMMMILIDNYPSLLFQMSKMRASEGLLIRILVNVD